ncbi:aminoglycoside 6-adenylyltransferase [Xylanibacillus composti]|uniref:Aminoglycoside 6-adenylyltransferase n=1 Tax=Xylanibacillus composti TaxID=1572762 RepID=A0A8J4H6B4_9BACL|nr:aminoglycoside 6-adenylyltransferase [Xylanibacillus composti]GIQ69654.1 aminoglycoside 6-adenylyltransferase [Xylanibacillus composti]
MRGEQEMLELIMHVAERDERIRAVYMNGSRTNSLVRKDLFQDYDIVYVVTETASFLTDEQWIQKFGDLLMVQEPDKHDLALGKEVDFARSYGYLMLFTDGNRIDLHLIATEYFSEADIDDSLTIPLLDKDGCMPPVPVPTDKDYHVMPPTEGEFQSCTNNFWWCLQNVAKGIWRDQLPYAMAMFHKPVREALDQMISWWIGMQHDYQVSVGAMNKYFKFYLPEPYWLMYERTYTEANYTQMWQSIFVACELFRTLGKEVAKAFDYPYPEQSDCLMTQYLQHVQTLPAEATTLNLRL